jgi:serine/threonine-protein kinase ATR
MVLPLLLKTPRMVLALAVVCLAVQAAPAAPPRSKVKPLMKDFMGLNVHTIGFKPKLYQPVCRLVRDYHNLDWDTGPNPATPTQFPKGEAGKAKWLDWGQMYGSWVKAGFTIDACIQWQTRSMPPEKWPNMPKNAYDYGKAFASYFGSRGHKLVESVEIGNEPGSSYPEKAYATIFENMAKGLRAGDPAMKIVTAAANIKGDKYSKPLAPFKAYKNLFDVINVHQYALKTGWPTWERSYPEDMSISYVSLVQSVIDWRDKNLPGKPVWLTEFGYDASTQPPPATGDFAKWMDVSDEHQAQYIVRSFLVFSALDLDRAYLYFFNDEDEPSFHASSGITRHYEPKPSYYAMRFLYQTLGEYRFAKAVEQQKGTLFVYDYVKGNDSKEHMYVAWAPDDRTEGAEQSIRLPARPLSASRMPLADGPAPRVAVEGYQAGKLAVQIDGSPVFIRVRLP